MILKLKQYKFHQTKSPISINDIHVNKIVVSNKFPICKRDFTYLVGCKMTFMHILSKSECMYNRF